MNSNVLLLLSSLLLLLTQAHSQSCKSSCGLFRIHYPFGTGPGCGSPAFQSHITCDTNHNLIFNTHTGSYPVQSIDYTNQVLYIQDFSMSTCSTNNPSTGFSLDWDAPFAFRDPEIIALLNCSTDSALFSSNSTLCDISNAPICSLLYTCPSINQLNPRLSACCIYSPVTLGPSFQMELNKFECSAYSGIHSFNGDESNPEGWKFGIALKYRFSVDNGYPSSCANCEKTGGVCGYTEPANAFSCNCGNGVNTTTNCYHVDWNGGHRLGLFRLIFGWGAMAWLLLY